MNWGAVQAVVGVIALLVLLWYAWHTMKLRFETQRQVRLSSLPVARVEFLRGPDRVFIRNSGGAIIAKAALQGFRFRGPDDGVWRCTFSPTTMLSPGASSASVFENITLEGYEGAPMLDQRALFEIAFSQACRGRSSIRLALYYRQQMKTGSSTPVLPLHILYRLALSKYFVREAKAKLQHSSDDLALSLVVVNLYDGLDNLLGAVASRLSIDLQEKASLVSTFESI